MPPDEPTLTLARLARLLERSAGGDLSLSQYRVLGLLASGDEHASRLASRLGVAKPTLTSIVDGLVDRGYVRRDTADGDRRVVRLSVTPAGFAVAESTGQDLRAGLDEVLAHADDPDSVLAALDDLHHALDRRWNQRDDPTTDRPDR